METANKSKYIIIGIVCLLAIALGGYVIFQHRQIKKISQLMNSEMTTGNESPGKDMSGQGKVLQDNIPQNTAIYAEGYGDIKELEYQLSAAEEELDAAHNQLSDQAAQKAETAKNMIEMQKKMLQDPAYQKMLRNTYKGQLDTIYGSLFSKLNLSPEKLDQFKELLTDQMLSAMEFSMDMLGSTPSEENRDKLQQQSKDLKDEYDAKISELIGMQDFITYEDYRDTLMERQTIEMFTESLGEGDKLTDTQKDSLVGLMFQERKGLYSQQGWNDEMVTFSSEYDDEGISKMMDRIDRTYNGYVRSAGSALSAAQLEQFKSYLNNQRDMAESAFKMAAQIYGGQTAQTATDNKTE